MTKIVMAPDNILSGIAKPVAKIDSSVQKTIAEMKKALSSAKDPEGVGLAAPQIGKSIRIFLAKPTPKDEAMIFINPEVVEMETPTAKFTRERKVGKKKKEVQKLEGCLSLKDIWGTVLRSPKVGLTYLDEKGRQQTKTFTGFLATIIQHEYDHLNGVLFPRRVLEQKGKLYKSTRDKKGEDVFEELELP